MVFLDSAKAFDLVNHSILLNKLYKYGIRSSLLDWCRDQPSAKSCCKRGSRDLKIGHYGRLGRLDAYTSDLGP